MKEIIVKTLGDEPYDLFTDYVNIEDIQNNLVISTTSIFNIEKYPEERFSNIIDIHKVNDFRFVNKFFEAVNLRLKPNGVFIGCAETKELRKERLFSKYPKGINYIYYFFDFILKRVFPKFAFTKKIYFILTKGQNRVMSRAEILGRLYSCGFEVLDEQVINRFFYFVVRKVKPPMYDLHPTYGPFIRLKRVGKNGKIIQVLKLRTMHPYAEYLQDYVFRKNQLQEGGKFKDDFRISGVGKMLRKLWIDELPMLYNLLKGDIKLVGVRPLSQHYFELYTQELQEKRVKFKPGLIPPFYAHLPKTLEDIINSELTYLAEYEKRPFMTDVKYLFHSLYNIFIKRARSK